MTSRAFDDVARRVLMFILVLGLAGTEIELLLLKHTDGVWQLLPLALMAVALVVIAINAAKPSASTVRALQVTMGAFLLSGALGVVLHYKGNVEWELERMASLAGYDLFKAAIMGATPALAPGTMIQLGLVGLLYTYQHPVSQARNPGNVTNEVSS